MYRSIQICRAVAALLVVLLHITAYYANPKYFGLSGIDHLFTFGRSGVEFFFVLSGFIITFVHWSDFGNPSRILIYAKKRAIRIYPTFWIIFACVYLIAASPLGSGVRLDIPTLLKTLALLPQASSDPISGTSSPILIVAWSLQYEILFYLLMGVFIVSRPIGTLISALVLTNMLACQADACVVSAPYLHTTFVLLFGLGAATAYICKTSAKVRHPLFLAGIGACTFVAFGIWHVVTGVQPVLGYGIASAVMVLGFVKAEDEGKLKVKQDWAVSLGDASYALYLIHYPLVSILCRLAVRIGLHGAIGAAIAAPVIVTVCVAASIGFNRFVERPLLRAFSGRRSVQTTAVPVGN
jgi:peptidoglycan/LPS O-acetylase OafA/YrhL